MAPDAKIPTKKELIRWYLKEEKSPYEIARECKVSYPVIYGLLKKYKIRIKSISEWRLSENAKIPTEKELRKLYLEDKKTSREIANEYNVSPSFILRLLKENKIQIRYCNERPSKCFKKLVSNKTFQSLFEIKKQLPSDAYVIDDVIREMYSGEFKSYEEFEKASTQAMKELSDVANSGFTNLGAYMGPHTVKHAPALPVLLGKVFKAIGTTEMSTSLENKLFRLYKSHYGPMFNDNPKKTIAEMKKRTANSEGKKKEIYQNLEKHYKETLDVLREAQ